MRLRYTTRAIADLTEIADYLVPRSPVGAQRVRAAILLTLQTIVDLPHAGRVDDPELRRRELLRDHRHRLVIHGLKFLAAMRNFRDAESFAFVIDECLRRFFQDFGGKHGWAGAEIEDAV